MWQELLSLDEKKRNIIAKMRDGVTLSKQLSKSGITEVLAELGAADFYLYTDELENFINAANDGSGVAYSGLTIAERLDAKVRIKVSEDGLLAHMIITGAYGGRGLNGPELVHALALGEVTKGINKLALKKVLVVSENLKPGEEYTQAVAQGKRPIAGKDARLVPLVEDVTKQVLAPKPTGSSDKVDMRDLGETITVGEGEAVMRLEPATLGIPGFTVQGKKLEPVPGNSATLKAGNGTEISSHDPNLLIASISGMPLIKDGTVEIENALCLKNVSVATGHVKFKGCLIITGDIEAGMMVQATGSITVAGFIESADVQAQGDILVGKGIIGRTVADDEQRTCVIKSGGSIKANYAQYALLQARSDIHLAMHSMSNDIRCTGDLTVLDSRMQHGTLSGGSAKVGGSILCHSLGVEGDTPTYVEAFARYSAIKDQLEQLRERYNHKQELMMEAIRVELEFRKRPKAERTDEEAAKVEQYKAEANQAMITAKSSLEAASSDFEQQLERNIIEVKSHVYTHVTVRFGDEKIITKNDHGSTVFSFNQYEISCKSSMLGSDIGSDV